MAYFNVCYGVLDPRSEKVAIRKRERERAKGKFARSLGLRTNFKREDYRGKGRNFFLPLRPLNPESIEKTSISAELTSSYLLLFSRESKRKFFVACIKKGRRKRQLRVLLALSSQWRDSSLTFCSEWRVRVIKPLEQPTRSAHLVRT